MNKLKIIWLCIKSKFIPIKNNTVFFDSFLGQYNDNPKYVSEELHSLKSDIKIVWSISEKNHESIPDYIQKVKYASNEYYDYAMNSAVVVDNHMGIRTFGFRRTNFSLLRWILKRPKQLAIATWHGTPLKKIGKDQIHRTVKAYMTSIDYCVYGCDIARDAIGEAFFIKEKMRPYGTPRNDILINNIQQSNSAHIKEKLGIPKDKSIVLFAPTFRNSIEMSGVSQINELNIEILLAELKKKFDNDFIFVFRAHHTVQEKVKKSEIMAADFFIDGNLGEDMAEYLLCTDVLITDYSSSMFDFALTKKPCFLYVPDLGDYFSKERGTYFPIEQLPFPYSTTADGIIENIRSFNSDLYTDKIEQFLVTINNVERGQASQLIARDIIEHLAELY